MDSDKSSDKSDEGVGSEGTIPASKDGIALGVDPEGSTFEPEEEAGEPDPADARKDDDKPTGL